MRDIYRLDKQQRGTVSIAKWAGYWGFWIRKLKPIKMASLTEFKIINVKDAVAINEIVALQFALEIVAVHRSTGKLEDRVIAGCAKRRLNECDGIKCFWEHATKYLNFNDEFFSKYII